MRYPVDIAREAIDIIRSECEDPTMENCEPVAWDIFLEGNHKIPDFCIIEDALFGLLRKYGYVK